MMITCSSGYCRKEDCHGSVTMSVRCRRSQLLVLLPLLIVLSMVTNVALFSRYRRDMSLIEEFNRFNTDEEVSSDDSVDEDQGSPGTPQQLSPQMSIIREKRRQRRKLRLQMRKNRERLARGGTTSKSKRIPEILPSEQSLSPNANFSACLLIKDDNEILNEWIAYHYHVLKLRRLVVAVDPLSTQSPRIILEKWKNITDLDVAVWHDHRYMPPEFMLTGRAPDEFMQDKTDFNYDLSDSALVEISNHRYRQRVFLAKCMRFLRNRGSSWLIHIDTDEYVVPSKLLRTNPPPAIKLPPLYMPGSVLDLLQQSVRLSPKIVRYPCISILRVLFGAMESDEHDRNKLVPPEFDSMKFETLRWRYHAPPENMTHHGNPKVILDVSAIPEEFFPKDVVYSIHRPVEEFCARNKDLDYNRIRRQPIGANHYLGSWERYNGRQDSRRSRATYDAKAFWQKEVDDGTRPWLKGLIRDMGQDKVIELLGSNYLLTGKSVDNGIDHPETS